jgi:hypothetical protein
MKKRLYRKPHFIRFFSNLVTWLSQHGGCHSGGGGGSADESKQIGLFLQSALHFVNGNQVKTIFNVFSNQSPLYSDD